MYCIKCGNKIEDGSKFCAECGAKVSTTTAQEPVVNKTAPAPVAQEATKVPPLVVPQVQNTAPVYKEEKTSKVGAGIIAIVALFFVIVGLIAAIIWVAFLAPHKEDENGSVSVKQEQESEQDDDKEVSAGDVAEVPSDENLDSAAEEKQIYTGEKTGIDISVRQVDNSDFPKVTVYASVTDKAGTVIGSLGSEVFKIQEIDSSGNVVDVEITDVYQVLGQDRISVNLVLDASGSMDSQNKMKQAKNAAISLLSQMELEKGDQVEIISFDDYVYLEHEFTNDRTKLENAIKNIDTNGMTALYDALYAGVFQTYYEDGVKCVIGFTDGMENASSYTFEDVVSLAQSTGIPVFIIGIGSEYDADALQELANLCSGKYYSAAERDLESILEDIYLSIYREQQDYYVVKYESPNKDDLNIFREVVLATSDYTQYDGKGSKSYVPETDISGAFSDSYMQMDYILEYSNQRELTESDLEGLSLAQLRIARNEIFARHGRQFKDSMLNQWFYSKIWYLNMPTKYSPTDFDAIKPSPLSRLESDNANFIREYENNIMDTRDIYPDASNVLLSDYDLALSKAVLKNALSQMQGYASTDILKENMRLVQEAINKEDIKY